MLAYKVMGAGVPELAVRAICRDTETAIAAAGTNQSTATSLTAAVNFLGTVASGTGVILSSSAASGDSQLVYNGGANAVTVYPPSGAAINGLPANTGVIVAIKTTCVFYCASSTQWAALLSA